MASITTQTADFITRVNEKFKADNVVFEATGDAGSMFDRVMLNNKIPFLFINRETGDIHRAIGRLGAAREAKYSGANHDQAIKNADVRGDFLR